ncbi:cytochrome b/b6 domain-containing protein [Mesorhizobium sp. ESP7-2]|uniref:cytochrome b n=1 Tax=Mesorhizobium sp. ESP7-2 TaxID=2876622 RepID=UPI001CCF73EA|nr:cytochrome b/b6 domain-containing protein [Mesorhizobium sp. ESP7-2]MBZ9706241.1 cytochrome b/b6 domain-containing protein [Mesorhizobium sp. ESP7-2]
MRVDNEPAGYTGPQILLHWTIAVLIVVQLVIGEDIKPAYRAFSRAAEPAAGAAAAHFLLYLFIFGMPITGALAWYFSFRAMGEIHELAKPVIIVVVGLHAVGASWQHFLMKSDVLVRMLRPAGRRLR